MGLFSWTVGLPLQPVHAVLALGRVIQREVDQERYSTRSVRRRLEQVESERESDPEHFSREREAQAIREITPVRTPATRPGGER